MKCDTCGKQLPDNWGLYMDKKPICGECFDRDFNAGHHGDIHPEHDVGDVQILTTIEQCIAAFKAIDERKSLTEAMEQPSNHNTHKNTIEETLCGIAKLIAQRCSMIVNVTDDLRSKLVTRRECAKENQEAGHYMSHARIDDALSDHTKRIERLEKTHD
jgi:hypothetical protein